MVDVSHKNTKKDTKKISYEKGVEIDEAQDWAERISIRALVIVFSSLLRRVLGSRRTFSFWILGKIGVL